MSTWGGWGTTRPIADHYLPLCRSCHTRLDQKTTATTPVVTATASAERSQAEEGASA